VPPLPSTAKAIEALKPGAERITYKDPRVAGLELRLSPSGHRAWSYRFRPRGGGKVERIKIDASTYSEAREKAIRLRAAILDGANPQALRRGRRATPSFEEVATRFLEEYARPNKAPSSVRNDQHHLKRCISAWGRLPVDAIGRADIVLLLEAIRKTAPVSSNRTKAVLSKLFNWSVEVGLLGSSPVLGIKPRSKETPRERTLTNEEIKAFWTATSPNSSINRDVADALRLILLTAQRPGQIAGLVEGELVDLDDETSARIEFPGGRMKSRRPHVLPLAPLALSIISEARQRNRGSAGIFASKFASRDVLARHSLSQCLRRLGIGFKPHDLRRSALTGMAGLGILREDRLAVAAHLPTDVHGSVYDRHERLPEKRAALCRWEARVAEIVGEVLSEPNIIRQHSWR
jgi:integrase